MRILSLALVLLLAAATVGAQEAAAPPSLPPRGGVASGALPVTEQDRCAWERYEYLRLVAEARLRISALEARLQTLEYEKQTTAEYAAVSARFRDRYNVAIEDLIYQDGVFRTRPGLPAAAELRPPGMPK